MNTIKRIINTSDFKRYDFLDEYHIRLNFNEVVDGDNTICDTTIIEGNTEDDIKQWFVTNYIEKYDSSSKVNQFKINGVTTWLSNTERMSRRASAEVLNSNGGTYNLILDDGNVIEIDCSSFLIMLDKIEQYAIQTRLKTNEHIANVKALETIDEVLAYDYKTGYPTPLEFIIKDSYVYDLDGNILLDKEDYDPTKSYTKDNYCKYKGTYYKFIVDSATGIIPTNNAYWEPVSVVEELAALHN